MNHFAGGARDDAEVRHTYTLGMPQLICGALSERWVFKEAGDIHWRMVTSDLGAPSGALVDETGERLYASFVRFRMESSAPLSAYAENEALEARGFLSRFGDKRFFSEVSFVGARGVVRVQMATVFVTRRTDNKSLSRATPQQLGRARCKVEQAVPRFGQGYQRIKRQALDGVPPTDDGPLLELAGESFDGREGASDVVPYEVNPIHDFNGASLLYFASYPRIHDVCERALFNARLARAGRTRLDAECAFLLKPWARDICYFANADAGDRLAWRLRNVEAVGRRLKIWSSLSREHDGERIADIFTIKDVAEDVSGALLA